MTTKTNSSVLAGKASSYPLLSSPPHQRLVTKDGHCTLNSPACSSDSWRRSWGRIWLLALQDLWGLLVSLRWRWVLLAFCASFIAHWLLFACLWYLLAHLNGDLAVKNHDDPPQDHVVCVKHITSFTAAFSFSLETQLTIGYGTMFPSGDCPSAIALLAVQMLLGLMLEAFITVLAKTQDYIEVSGSDGLMGPPPIASLLSRTSVSLFLGTEEAVSFMMDGLRSNMFGFLIRFKLQFFNLPRDNIVWSSATSPNCTITFGAFVAKIARPQKRAGAIEFSPQAVVGQHQGQTCLMIRVTNLIQRPLVDVKVSAVLYEEQEGQALYQTSLDFHLDHLGQYPCPFFIFPLTFYHQLDRQSPLYPALCEGTSKHFELVIFLTALQEGTGDSCHKKTSYLRQEIQFDRRFLPALGLDARGRYLVSKEHFDTSHSKEPLNKDCVVQINGDDTDRME